VQDCTDEKVRYEIERNSYVDDYLGSFHSENQLISTAELNKVLSKREFNLTKWISNVKSLPKEKVSPKVVESSGSDLLSERTLGLHWNPNQDIFEFGATLDE